MSAGLTVTSGERGMLRVFALDAELAALPTPEAVTDALFAALGVTMLEAADIQIVTLADLSGLRLTDFLREAYDVPDAQINAHRGLLDAVTGKVALLRSGAFAGQAVTLPSEGPARLLACLDEPGVGPVPLVPLPFPDAGTLAVPARPARSDAAILGRVAMAALLAIFALTALVVWIAG